MEAAANGPYHAKMLEKLTQFDLHHRIAEQPATSLVLFTSVACASCRYFKVILTKVAELHEDWHVYEVDAQHEMGLTREFEVFHLPALFLFHAGEFHAELHCQASIEAVELAVSDALRKPAREAP